MNATMNAVPDQLAQFDWGTNRDGWEFEIHNQIPLTQVVVVQWPDLWGPNYNGWEVELTNSCGHDLIFVPEVSANVASCPQRIATGATGLLKGKSRAGGGPANCNFAYRHPEHLMNSGGIAIAARADASRARISASATGTTDVLYTENPAANAVQTITYMQR